MEKQQSYMEVAANEATKVSPPSVSRLRMYQVIMVLSFIAYLSLVVMLLYIPFHFWSQKMIPTAGFKRYAGLGLVISCALIMGPLLFFWSIFHIFVSNPLIRKYQALGLKVIGERRGNIIQYDIGSCTIEKELCGFTTFWKQDVTHSELAVFPTAPHSGISASWLQQSIFRVLLCHITVFILSQGMTFYVYWKFYVYVGPFLSLHPHLTPACLATSTLIAFLFTCGWGGQRIWFMMNGHARIIGLLEKETATELGGVSHV